MFIFAKKKDKPETSKNDYLSGWEEQNEKGKTKN